MAQTSTNEALQDRLIAHQIGLLRLGNAEERAILKMLEVAQRQFRRELAQRLAQWYALSMDAGTPVGALRLQALLAELRKLRRVYLRSVEKTLTDDLEGIAAHERKFVAGIAQIAIGAKAVEKLDIALSTPELIRTIVRSKPFQGALLRKHFAKLIASSETRSAAVQLRQAIESGLIAGDSIMTIVRRVNAGALGLERRAVGLLVHSAVQHVTNQMQLGFARENADLLEGVKWLSALDLSVCELCASRDGYLYDADSLEPLDGGPPWDAGPSQLHFGCRCTSVPVLKSFKDLGINRKELDNATRAAIDNLKGDVPAKVRAEEWLRGRKLSELQEMFGQARGAMIKDGAISVGDLLRKDGIGVRTLQELWEEHNTALLKAGFKPIGFPGAEAIRDAL